MDVMRIRQNNANDHNRENCRIQGGHLLWLILRKAKLRSTRATRRELDPKTRNACHQKQIGHVT